MILPDQYYRPMVHGPRPLFKGYPLRHPRLPLRNTTVTPTAIGPMLMVYYHRFKAPNLCASSCPNVRGPRTRSRVPTALHAFRAPAPL